MLSPHVPRCARVVMELLGKKINPNIINADGMTPLHEVFKFVSIHARLLLRCIHGNHDDFIQTPTNNLILLRDASITV
jgi:hypothetical protein